MVLKALRKQDYIRFGYFCSAGISKATFWAFVWVWWFTDVIRKDIATSIVVNRVDTFYCINPFQDDFSNFSVQPLQINLIVIVLISANSITNTGRKSIISKKENIKNTHSTNWMVIYLDQNRN